MAIKKYNNLSDSEQMDIFGCDIGNGYSYISILEAGGKQPRSAFPTNIRSLNVKIGMPSESYLVPPEGNPIIVFDAKGGSARKRILKDPERAVKAVKTQLRRETLNIPGLNDPVSPYDVYAAIARDLVSLGNHQRIAEGKPPIYRMVLTYPASFNDYQNGIDMLNRMQSSIENVVLDGHHLEVVRRLPEPAAVAIDYLSVLQEKESADLQEFTTLVYDLGHGTFDVAVVTARSKGDPYQVWKTDGLPDVGGKDFDQRLLEDILEQLKDRFGYTPRNEVELEQIMRDVIDVKHGLTDDEVQVFYHQNKDDGSYMEIPVTQQHFEELTSDLLAETMMKTQQVLHDFLQGNPTGRNIDSIVLAGGSSRMPMVRRALEETITPKCPIYLFRPSEAVSMGAARYARHVAQLYTRNSYYFLNETVADLNGRMELVIRPDISLPAHSEPVKLRLLAAHYDIRVYRPKNEADQATDQLNIYDNLVYLHFDIPSEDEYTLTMTVSDDYNITVTISNDKVALSSSTQQD